MHTDSQVLDPALASDKTFLKQRVAEAKLKGGYTFGFKSSSEARSARRRLYYVISQMAEYDQQLMKGVEFKLKGRMIAIIPKITLSSSITQE